jgi:hypothetical protein
MPRVMDVYSGWLTIDFRHDTLTRDRVISWVPLNDTGKIQKYLGGKDGIVTTASISSFGDAPEVAAVDRASTLLKDVPISGEMLDGVLVLEVDVAVRAGALHRVAYQVTVLARTDSISRGAEFPGQVKEIPVSLAVPSFG